MSQATVASIKKMISKLQDERAALVKGIEEIDLTFAQLGLDPEAATKPRRGRKPGSKNKVKSGVKPGPKPGKKRGRKPGSKNKVTKKVAKTTKKKGRRTRKTFAISGEESIVQFVKGADKPTTADVNAHWTKEGRGGKADNTITKLVKDKKLKRTNIPGKRGSTYSV